MATLISIGSPFTSESDDQLVHLTAGTVANDEIKSHLVHAYERGEDAYRQFHKQRLSEGTKTIFEKTTIMKSKTFTNLSKKKKSQ